MSGGLCVHVHGLRASLSLFLSFLFVIFTTRAPFQVHAGDGGGDGLVDAVSIVGIVVIFELW